MKKIAVHILVILILGITLVGCSSEKKESLYYSIDDKMESKGEESVSSVQEKSFFEEEIYSDKIFLIDEKENKFEEEEYIISFNLKGYENFYSCYVKIPKEMNLQYLNRQRISVEDKEYVIYGIKKSMVHGFYETNFKKIYENEKMNSYICPDFVMDTDAIISVLKPFMLNSETDPKVIDGELNGEEKEVITITTYLLENNEETESFFKAGELDSEGADFPEYIYQEILNNHEKIAENILIKNEDVIQTIDRMTGIQFGNKKVKNIEEIYGYQPNSVSFKVKEQDEKPMTKLRYHISLVTESSILDGTFIGLKGCEEIKDEQGNLIGYQKKENKNYTFYLENGKGYWSIDFDTDKLDGKEISISDLEQVIEKVS